MRFHRSIISLALYLYTTKISLTNAQGCTNTCPPINYGIPVPSLCEGDDAGSFANLDKRYTPCDSTRHNEFSFNEMRGRILVLANFYVGCNAGRRESGVYAHVAQRYYEQESNNVVFVTSLKGGATCNQWASMYQKDAVKLYPKSTIVPNEMPIAVNDGEYEIRDDFFTTPFGHPSYVILDANLKVRHKFIGPCCGYESFYDCTADIAKGLDGMLSTYLDALLAESKEDDVGVTPPLVLPSNQSIAVNPINEGDEQQQQEEDSCGEFSEWSVCSTTCGPGIQFRYRTDCPALPVETRSCTAEETCPDDIVCTPTVETVATGFQGARDVSFHPTPGLHLGNYSEGRTFHAGHGEEVWVINAHNHSVSIVASVGTEFQTTLSRRDRGYYHYMINATALSFNMVADSGRTPDRDSFQYWAVCNDNLNTYLDTKEPNYFMGPTLYNSDPGNSNLVNRLGEECSEEEECWFLHADMLHESPGCIGIAHDPEVATTHGNVYWAFDTTGNGQNGELVRFDFQQPHGPGSMDHSVASVRRYTGVVLTRGPSGVHAGMVVHPTLKQLFIAVPGANKVMLVDTDSGSYARIAREEYPIFSNRLPSFEYSIFECETQRDFAVDIEMPSGLALSNDGNMLYVAERGTGDILVFEVATASLLKRLNTGFEMIGGLAVSPVSGALYFVDEATNGLYKVDLTKECAPTLESRQSLPFQQTLADAKAAVPNLSLYRDYACIPDPIVADSAFFDQVHVDTGYASDNPDVQSMAGMDDTAVLLANRTDCGYDSELNFDQLLLGGYYCHPCLPGTNGAECDAGGSCTNEQWLGYTCDNEFVVTTSPEDDGLLLERADGSAVNPGDLVLREGVTYRFVIKDSTEVCLVLQEDTTAGGNCASNGPLTALIDESTPRNISLVSIDQSIPLQVETLTNMEDEAIKSRRAPWIVGGCVGAVSVLLLSGYLVMSTRRDYALATKSTDNTGTVTKDPSVENQSQDESK